MSLFNYRVRLLIKNHNMRLPLQKSRSQTPLFNLSPTVSGLFTNVPNFLPWLFFYSPTPNK